MINFKEKIQENKVVISAHLNDFGEGPNSGRVLDRIYDFLYIDLLMIVYHYMYLLIFSLTIQEGHSQC